MAQLTAADRFWPKVDQSGDCRIWTASRDSNGYGKFWDGRRYISSHRFAYKLLTGPIPDGLTLDHLCRNPPCCNPAHLEPVTQCENVRRAMALITHCPAGHPYDEANTYRCASGTRGACRNCRACHRERERARWRASR